MDMKAKEILDWIIKESINGEILHYIDVPEQGDAEWEQNENWWWDMLRSLPPAPVPAGKYICLYDTGEFYLPRCGDADSEIEVGDETICLYRVEE